MQRGAFNALGVAHAYRGHRPILDGDRVHWISDEEFRAAEIVLRNALAAHDHALQPATPEFVEALLGMMSAAFPQSKATDADIAMKIQVYIDVLIDFPPDLIAAAARKALRRCKFFPTIAELLSGWDGASVEEQLIERIDARNSLSHALGEPAYSLGLHRCGGREVSLPC